jgi:hypothetical protein
MPEHHTGEWVFFFYLKLDKCIFSLMFIFTLIIYIKKNIFKNILSGENIAQGLKATMEEWNFNPTSPVYLK